MELMEGVDKQELERRVRENDEYLKKLKTSGGTTDLGAGEIVMFVLTIVVVCIAAFFWSQS